MFSGLASFGREDFSWPRSKKALPVFLLLWTGCLLLAGLYLVAIRSHLVGIERTETERMLDTYLAAHSSPLRHFGSLLFRHDDLLEGLTFVRVVQGGDQMLLVGDNRGGSGLKSYIDLSPMKEGVWLKVALGEESRRLTVAVRQYDNGGIIQVGKDAEETWRLYRGIIGKTIGIVALGGLFLWPISLYFIRESLGPLTASRQMIEALEQSATGLLPEEGNGPELDRLYRQINRLIRQNRRLVTEMQQSLDNVAHDLRTPMTRLRSVAEFGLQADDETRLREALSDCLEESERVLAMLRIMMSVAEAETGTMRLEVRDCDLAETLAQAVTLYEYVAEERRIAVSLVTDGSVAVRVDPTRIAQVWANLLDNAIKYGRDGGWVKISARRTADAAEVIFADNGMGISESEQGKIWERLYRGDRSRSQKGLGLGLSFVRAVVAAHGGTATVESVLHEGSRFTVRLPLAHPADLALAAAKEKSQTRGEWSDRRTSGI